MRSELVLIDSGSRGLNHKQGEDRTEGARLVTSHLNPTLHEACFIVLVHKLFKYTGLMMGSHRKGVPCEKKTAVHLGGLEDRDSMGEKMDGCEVNRNMLCYKLSSDFAFFHCASSQTR